MRALLVFLALVAVGNGTKPGIRITFGQGEGFGESFFYRVATTVDDALDDGWKLYRRPEGPLPQLDMYCPDDKTLCALFDDTRYIAGLQVALRGGIFSNNPFDLIKQGFTKWETTINGECTTLWTLQQYFVSEEGLSASLESRLESRNNSKILQEGGVWLTGIDGELLKVSTDDADIRQSVFTEQACLPAMGQHYYYNMSSETECTAEQMYPWFPMTFQGKLVATGFMVFGQFPRPEGETDWFEHVNRFVVQAIIPRAPECLYDLVDSNGVLTMHIYYTDEPQTITC